MGKKRPVQMVPLPSYGQHMTIEDFIERCRQGDINDDDGHGNWATETEMMANRSIYPETVSYDGTLNPNFRRRATHVVWFNT